jgi:hypothetical protein
MARGVWRALLPHILESFFLRTRRTAVEIGNSTLGAAVPNCLVSSHCTDADLRPEYEHIFRELKLQQRRLAAEIEVATVPQQSRLAEEDLKVDRAIGLFSKLRTTAALALAALCLVVGRRRS